MAIALIVEDLGGKEQITQHTMDSQFLSLFNRIVYADDKHHIHFGSAKTIEREAVMEIGLAVMRIMRNTRFNCLAFYKRYLCMGCFVLVVVSWHVVNTVARSESWRLELWEHQRIRHHGIDQLTNNTQALTCQIELNHMITLFYFCLSSMSHTHAQHTITIV